MGLSASKGPAVVTEEQIKDARAVLDLVDKNKDGMLGQDELELLQAMYESKNPQVVELLSKYDTNNDGQLDLLELKPLTEGVEVINQVQEILTRYDTNKDGTLDDDEIKALLTEYQERKGDAVRLLHRWDVDKDGKIDAKELEFLKKEVTTIQSVLRDSPLSYSRYSFTLPAILGDVARYSAYTSDIGESFRPIMNKWTIRASYGVSWLYVMSDVGIEARQQYMVTKGSDVNGLMRTVTERALFQTFASMAIPAFMIHTAVHKSQDLLAKRGATGALRKWGPTVIGVWEHEHEAPALLTPWHLIGPRVVHFSASNGLSIVPALPFMLDHPVEEGVHWFMGKVWPLKKGQIDPYETHVHTHGITQHHHSNVDAKPDGLITTRF